MNTLKLKRLIAHPFFLVVVGFFIFVQTAYALDRFTGAISGRVYDDNTGNPLAGVTVTLTPNTYIDGATDYTTTTDQQGYYSVSGMKCYYTTDRTFLTLTWLSYTASVSVSGYQDYESGELTFSRGYYDISQDIALKPLPSYQGTITGIVTDAHTGKPLPNGGVFIKDVAYGVLYDVTTDSQGRYTATVQRSKISGGMGIYWYRYTVNIAWEGYKYYTSNELSFSESVTTIEHNVAVVPLQTGILSGQVIDAQTKQPITNVTITFKPHAYGYGSKDYTTTTDAQGNYNIEDVLRYVSTSGGQVTWLSYKAYITQPGYESYTSTGKTFSTLVWDAGEDIALKPLPLAEIKQEIYLDTSYDESTQFAKPQVICDDTGYVVVDWQKQVASPQSTGHLYSRTSLDYGLNWEPTQEVSLGMTVSRIDDAQLGHDAKGNVYLSWRMAEGNHQYLYFTRTIERGANWADDKLIKDTAVLSESGKIVFKDSLAPAKVSSGAIHLKCQDNSGRVYILESENQADTGTLLFVYSLDQGQTWNEIELGLASDSQELTMTCDNNGNVYIVGIRNIPATAPNAVGQKVVVFKAIAVHQQER